MLNYTDEQIDKLIADIFSGAISVDKLPVDLYKAIAEYLGGALDEIKDTASKPLMKALKKNIFEFSGAKVYSQVQDISLLAENEAIKTFAAFKKEALAIYEQYNKQWLQTEYSTAVAQGQNAVRWEQIQEQKDTLPFLQYSAVVDSQTSEICRPLDGITLPVGHPFWVKNSPLNHWNCRCTFKQLDGFDAKVTKAADVKKAGDEIAKEKQPMFNTNSGITKEIFPKDHPYFEAVKDGK